MERSRTTDMCTLAFPQALGTGIVVQVQLRMTDSAESDTEGIGDATNAEASAWGGATSVTGSNVEVISPRFGISKSGISRCCTPCQASTASPPSRPSFFRDSIRPACFRLNRLYSTAKRETPRSRRDLIDPAESFKPRRPQNHTTTRTAHAFAFIPFRVYTVQCQSTDSSPFPSNATQSPCKRTHAGT